MSKAADTSKKTEAAITRAFEFLTANKKELLVALADYLDNPARFSFIDAEFIYIQSSLQALANTCGITNMGSASMQQNANLPSQNSDKLSIAATEKLLPQPTTRRKHRDAFDLVLLASLHISEQLTYDVGLDMLFQAALALEPASERPSLTAKLNRWKKDGYVRWLKSSKMHLTPDGFALYKEKVRACARPGGGLDDVAVALNNVFGISTNFDAVLTAR